MFVWMILATFIVMLASFNLAPRTDMANQQITPLAEAAVTKFLAQHDAAVRYAEKTILNYHNYITDPAHYTGPANPRGLSEGADHVITGCTTPAGQSGGTGNLCGFLPIGFKYEANVYYSTLYCLSQVKYTDKVDSSGKVTREVSAVEGASYADCNDTAASSVYVITYGKVPARWKNVASQKIVAEYYSAMGRRIAMGASGGIVVKARAGDVRNKQNSKFVIEGINPQNNSIPPRFLSDDSKFKSLCLKNDDVIPETPCIIYVTNL